MSKFKIPFSRFALQWATTFLLALVTGGIIAFPLAGIEAIHITLAVGVIIFSFLILLEMVISPYKLLFGDNGVTLFFRLKPSDYFCYVEIEGMPLSYNENRPVLKLKGRRRVYKISFEAANEISNRMKAMNEELT